VAPPHVLTEFSFPIVPRYAEVDQQGVVFNAHYMTWFDEAFTAFLDHAGMSYPDMIATGLDVQVVRTEIDFMASVR
jgi:acyl-CoA thioester hydrolase